MKKNTDDKLKTEIEKALNKLLEVQNLSTKEDREELRSNVRLAMQWKAVENKLSDADWGSGFSDKEKNGHAGLDDD